MTVKIAKWFLIINFYLILFLIIMGPVLECGANGCKYLFTPITDVLLLIVGIPAYILLPKDFDPLYVCLLLICLIIVIFDYYKKE